MCGGVCVCVCVCVCVYMYVEVLRIITQQKSLIKLCSTDIPGSSACVSTIYTFTQFINFPRLTHTM